MRSLSYIFILFVILTSSCTGYKPIFSESNFKFNITNYSISGNKNVGKQLYLKLNNLSKLNKNNPDIINVYLLINSTINKIPTAKDRAGKVLGYKIAVSSTITMKDSSIGDELVNESFETSSTYKVQEQFSETKNVENDTLQNLINQIYDNLLIKINQNI